MAGAVEHYRKVTGDQHTMRVGYIVEDVGSEDEAITATSNASELFLPLIETGFDWKIDARRNQWRWRTNIGVEEIQRLDSTRVAQTAKYYTYVVYAHKAVCPIPTYDWGTQSETVYEGVLPAIHKPKPGEGIIAEDIGIEQENSNGSLTVKGVQRMYPAGRVNVVWQPLEEAYSNMQFNNQYMRAAVEMVGKVNSSVFLDAWNPGEVLMVSFTGKQIDAKLDTYEFNFGYQIRPNRPAVVIGGITVGDVEGWQYVWGSRSQAVAPTQAPVKQFRYAPYKYIRLETIYPTADLNELFFSNAGINMIQQCPYFQRIDFPDNKPSRPNAPPPWQPVP